LLLHLGLGLVLDHALIVKAVAVSGLVRRRLLLLLLIHD
jgi:hypothetical protein